MKIVKSVVISAYILLSLNTAVQAAGTCPSLTELQNKNNYYQTQALSMMSGSSSVDKATALLEEQTNYYNSLFPNCLNYFKATAKPDCSRVTVMTTGYTMADDNKKSIYKSQLSAIKPQLLKLCPIESSAIDYFVK